MSTLSVNRPFADKRTQERHQVYLAGELIGKGGARLQRCAIRDMSLDGARIDTGFYVDVPRRVFLLEEESGSLFECEVRWQQGREIGLFFLDVSGRTARQALIQKHA